MPVELQRPELFGNLLLLPLPRLAPEVVTNLGAVRLALGLLAEERDGNVDAVLLVLGQPGFDNFPPRAS